MGNTGLRPDEASRLEHRDLKIAKDDATGQRILEIEAFQAVQLLQEALA